MSRQIDDIKVSMPQLVIAAAFIAWAGATLAPTEVSLSAPTQREAFVAHACPLEVAAQVDRQSTSDKGCSP